MVHNIYFSVCGEGYGHSSRDMAIAAKLKKAGANVLMGSYGYVLDRLKKRFDCIKIENFSSTCVVADGRSACVFAAFKLGIPCIIISN